MRVARRRIDESDSSKWSVSDRRRRLVAPLGHEGLVKPIERLEPCVEVDGCRLQDHAKAKTTDPHLAALEAKFAGQPHRLISPVGEELRCLHPASTSNAQSTPSGVLRTGPTPMHLRKLVSVGFSAESDSNRTPIGQIPD